MKFLFAALFFAALMVSTSLHADESRRDFPVGVYASWELANAYADQNGLPLREFLDSCLAKCRENGVNALWVTNIGVEDLPLVQEVCRKHSIRLLANACEGRVDSYFADEASPLREQVKRMREAASAELDYWIISDEPDVKHAEHLRQYVGILRETDPARHRAFVVTHHMIDALVGKVPVEMAAVDPYPFFGPDDPNGPHTDASSIAHFRGVGEHFVRVCRAAGVEPWLMPQAFAEIWGGYRYDGDGMLYARPGAYLHWITPTVEQIRWQVFESIRQGAQGIVFFQLYPPMLPSFGNQEMPDVPWKEVLLKEGKAAGFGGLLTVHGKSTPQLAELGRIFPLLRKYSELLLGALPAERVPKWLGDTPASVCVAAFRQPVGHKVFLVLVNDNFNQPSSVGVLRSDLRDLVSGKMVGAALELPPGGGAILIQGSE